MYTESIKQAYIISEITLVKLCNSKKLAVRHVLCTFQN